MSGVQVVRSSKGEYRWRFVDSAGRAVAVLPGRVRISGLTGSKRKRVEQALDDVLAKMARDSDAKSAKA